MRAQKSGIFSHFPLTWRHANMAHATRFYPVSLCTAILTAILQNIGYLNYEARILQNIKDDIAMFLAWKIQKKARGIVPGSYGVE